MNYKMMFVLLMLIGLLIVVTGSVSAQGPRACASEPCTPGLAGFTYQGQLANTSGPVNATCSVAFSLWNSQSSGTQVGANISQSLTLSAGYFTSAPLDFGTTAFDGSVRYLQVTVQCPGDTVAVTLPRQLLTATPYALFAKNSGVAATATSFSGSLAGDVNGTQIGTSVVGLRGYPIASIVPTNGQVLKYDGSQWTPSTFTAANGWNLTGNSGSSSASFVGTTDNVTLTMRVNNVVGWRLVPSGTNTPNVISGSSGNWVKSGVKGATISGGGDQYLNSVLDDYGVVGGGGAN